VPSVLPGGGKSPPKNEPIIFKAVEGDQKGHRQRNNKLVVVKVERQASPVRTRDRVLEGARETLTMATTPTHL
jgi:hypothetical protein